MGKIEVNGMRPTRLAIDDDDEEDEPWSFSAKEHHSKKKTEVNCDNSSLPPNMEFFSNQVAGHMQDGVNLGMVKGKNRVYKPIARESCGNCEISFYEDLKSTSNPILLELRQHVPKYHGTEVLTVDGKQVKYIVLDDITRDFKEPCIMDIKIGRRTYDPMASYQKIMKEDQKYHETKRDLGFCIPGFQVYKISNGRVVKYGKEYGKNLNKDTVADAFKIFLNANTGLSRTLVTQFLTSLWRIQNWVRKQRQLHFYSSSLLLVYDAKRLKQNVNNKQLINPPEDVPKARPTLLRVNSLNRPMSVSFRDKSEPSKTSFSGLLTKDGPILVGSQTTASPTRIKQFSPLPERKDKPPSLKRMHSFQNNYDKELQTMKVDYENILEQLVNSRANHVWATVKMIDFAHVFPTEHGEQDSNYLEGIENLVKIFEEFLMETDPNSNS